MGWLAKLFGAENVLPRYGVATEEPAPIDWTHLESKLLALAEKELKAFASSHQHETFYGLGFDRNSEQGQVLLCLNTRAGQLEAARGSMARSPQLYVGESLEDVAAGIEWGFGDWKYQGINVGSAGWEDGWSSVEEEVANAVGAIVSARKFEKLSALRSDFLGMATRALLRILDSDAVKTLCKERGFRVLCADHDESPESGFARIETLAEARAP